jgi:Fic family protein
METDFVDPTAEELLNEIAGVFLDSHPQKPENSFTLRELMNRTNSSEMTALRFLDDLISSGKLNKIRIGKKNYYYPK